MVSIKSYLSVNVCLLLMTWAIGNPMGLGGTDDKSNWSEDLEAEFQAQSLEDKKREHANDGDKSGSEKASINLDNVVVEYRIVDCKKGWEIIATGDDGTGTRVCYLHQMNDAYYNDVCLGQGKVNQLFSVKEEITDKEFLTQNGSDSVCRNRSMYLITPVKDLDANVVGLKQKPNKGKFLDFHFHGRK